MTLKGHILLTGLHRELGMKETISQPCIKADDRLQILQRTLVCNPQKLQEDLDTEIHLDMKNYNKTIKT